MRERVTLPNKEKTKARVTYCRTRRRLTYHRSRRRRVTHYRARGRRVTYYRTKARMVIYYGIRTRMDATPGKKGSLPFILRISPCKLSNQELWNLSCASKHIFLLVRVSPPPSISMSGGGRGRLPYPYLPPSSL